MKTIQLSKLEFLALLRDMPAPKAIPRLLAVSGGSMTLGGIADALELKGKTLDNLLPILVRAGVVRTSGRIVTLNSPEADPRQPRDLPKVAPMVARDLPETAPNTARDLPETCPKSGNTVNDTQNPETAKSNSPISIVFSSLEDSKTTKKPKDTTSQKIQPRVAALLADLAWAALVKKPDFDVPNWLNLAWWSKWLEDLAARKIKVTAGALCEHLEKLKLLEDAGISQETAIRTAIGRGWKTVGEVDWFASKQPPARAAPRAKTGTTEENFAALQAAFGQQREPPTVEVL